jgi:hypothetical protein
MSIKRTRKPKPGKIAKKSKTKQVSRETYVRVRLFAAAALVVLAVMAIVVDASDQSASPAVASPGKSPTSAAVAYDSISSPVLPKATTPDSTYVGCLRVQEDGRKFVLTEIGGPDAPKSRNWKTMFVTKKSGKLEVTPTGNLRLRPHVDQTVQLTGKRTEKAFAARSIRVVGSTCN